MPALVWPFKNSRDHSDQVKNLICDASVFQNHAARRPGKKEKRGARSKADLFRCCLVNELRLHLIQSKSDPFFYNEDRSLLTVGLLVDCGLAHYIKSRLRPHLCRLSTRLPRYAVSQKRPRLMMEPDHIVKTGYVHSRSRAYLHAEASSASALSRRPSVGPRSTRCRLKCDPIPRSRPTRKPYGRFW